MTYSERAVCDQEPCYHCAEREINKTERRRAALAVAVQRSKTQGRVL